MRKYTVIHKKGVTTIQEVEVVLITAVEDPSIRWSLKRGEYKVRVLKPTCLFEKQNDGSLIPPVWYSHGLYDSVESACTRAEADIQGEMEREAYRTNIKFDVVACLERCKKIQVITL